MSDAPTDEHVQEWTEVASRYLRIARAVAEESGEPLHTVLLALTWRTLHGVHQALTENRAVGERALEIAERQMGDDEPWRSDD